MTKNDLAETGADGVVDRIIYDGLVVRADSVHLLERTVTEPIPAARTSNVGFTILFSCFLR